jgi:hypothetical protein
VTFAKFIGIAAAVITATTPVKASNNVTLNEQLGCDRLLELSATAANDAMECVKVKERVNGEQSRCFLYGVGMYALNQPTGIVQAPKEIRRAVIKACIMLTHDVSEAKAEQVAPKIFAMFEHSSFLEENELYAEIGRTKAKQAAEVQRKKNAEIAAEEAKAQRCQSTDCSMATWPLATSGFATKVAKVTSSSTSMVLNCKKRKERSRQSWRRPPRKTLRSIPIGCGRRPSR